MKHPIPQDLSLSYGRTQLFVRAILFITSAMTVFSFTATNMGTQLLQYWQNQSKYGFHVTFPVSDPMKPSKDIETQTIIFETLEDIPHVKKMRIISRADSFFAHGLLVNQSTKDEMTIDVETKPGHSVDIEEIAEFLAEELPNVKVEEGLSWFQHTEEIISWFLILCILFINFLFIILVIIASYAVYSDFLKQKKNIEILDSVGAGHNYVARIFSRHAVKLGSMPVIMGSVTAFIIFFYGIGDLLFPTFLIENPLRFSILGQFIFIPFVIILTFMVTSYCMIFLFIRNITLKDLSPIRLFKSLKFGFSSKKILKK